MIQAIKYQALGQANFGWLDARHHFSFGNYYNPKRMGFGKLRVINDDIIKAGTGFDLHPHQNMEIITYVREGAITHKDNQGNEGRTDAGDVQVMSAGTGIYHSEFNLESTDTRLYQIWIEPNQHGVKPRWDAAEFPTQPNDGLQLLVGNSDPAPLFIYADASIYTAKLSSGRSAAHKLKGDAYLLVSKGVVKIDGVALSRGDGAEITNNRQIQIDAVADSDILLIDLY